MPGMGENHLEVVESFKLLSVKIRGYTRLCMLRRLKALGATKSELFRSVLELAVPVWQPALTVKESSQIESKKNLHFV